MYPSWVWRVSESAQARSVAENATSASRARVRAARIRSLERHLGRELHDPLRVLEVDLRALVGAEVQARVREVRLRDQHGAVVVVERGLLRADVGAVEQVEGLRDQLQPRLLPDRDLAREPGVDRPGPGQAVRVAAAGHDVVVA